MVIPAYSMSTFGSLRLPVDLPRSYATEEMMAHPVDPRVGNARNNEPGLCEAFEWPAYARLPADYCSLKHRRALRFHATISCGKTS